jgi:rhodanese-related sulfurtransferase
MLKKSFCLLILLGVAMTVRAAVLDVRSLDEIRETGMVQDAENVDIKSGDFIRNFEALKIPKTEEVDIYCRSGVRAGRALEILKSLGYENVRNLGGYEAAAKSLGRPLVKP